MIKIEKRENWIGYNLNYWYPQHRMKMAKEIGLTKSPDWVNFQTFQENLRWAGSSQTRMDSIWKFSSCQIVSV